MEESIRTFGYLGIFLASFLSATLLPLGSEAFVALAVVLGYHPWLILLFATAGNVMGALVNYVIGKHVADLMVSRFMRVSPETLQKAETWYGRWGTPVLFFSWVPGVGDPLTVIGGALRVDLAVFAFWVLLGRVVRYAVVLGVVQVVLERA